MAVADLVSTLSVGSVLLKYLETNPFFKLIGLPGLFVLNIGVAGAFYYGYRLSNRLDTRYSIILCLLLVSLFRVFVVWNNIIIAKNPPTVEQAQALTTEIKNNYYLYRIIIPMLTAYIPGIFAFILFRKDHRIKSIEAI